MVSDVISGFLKIEPSFLSYDFVVGLYYLQVILSGHLWNLLRCPQAMSIWAVLRARGKQLCIFSELKGTLCTKLASFTFYTPLVANCGLIGSPDTIGNISWKEIAVNSVPYVVWGLFD